MAISAEEVLAEIGPVQEILDAHDGVVTVLDTSDGNIMLSLDGGCNGCSSTPMTAMQIYYSLKKLEAINDVIFVNGELPEYMRTFIDQKMAKEAAEGEQEGGVQQLSEQSEQGQNNSQSGQEDAQDQQNGYSEQSTQNGQEPGEIV